jgi:DNA-binding transcriptional MerR regulator
LQPRRQHQSRLYSEQDVERLTTILQLKKFGFTLAEIRSLIKRGGAASESFGLSREQCGQQMEFLEERVRELESAILDLRQLISKLQ